MGNPRLERYVQKGGSAMKRSLSKLRLAELADHKIDTSDIPEVDETFFKSAKLKVPDNETNP